jgi:hypothetical protein
MRLAVVVAVLGLAACGSGMTQTLTELPANGECQARVQSEGGTCTRGIVDHAVSGALTRSAEGDGDLGGNAQIRWRFAYADIDERLVHRAIEERGYLSLAAGGGLQISVLGFVPGPTMSAVRRYVDVGGLIGVEMGAIKFDTIAKLRADWYYGAWVELEVPDLGPLRYVPSPGVPGVRVTVRRTDYAQEWTTANTVSIGLVWRWGRAIDVHASNPYTRMMRD